SGIVRFMDSVGHSHRGLLVGPSKKDVSDLSTDRKSGYDHPFNQLIGGTLQQQPVFESAGFPFIGIADEVPGFRTILRNEAPYQSRSKPCSTPAAKIRLLDHIQHVGGRHAGEYFLQRFITTHSLIFVQSVCLFVTTNMLRQGPFHVRWSFTDQVYFARMLFSSSSFTFL